MERRVSMVLLARQEHKAQLVTQALAVGTPGRREQQARQGLTDSTVLKAHREQPGHSVRLGQRVRKARLARQVLKAHRASLVFRGQQVPLARQDRTVLMGLKDQLARLDHRGQQVIQVSRVRRALKERQD